MNDIVLTGPDAFGAMPVNTAKDEFFVIFNPNSNRPISVAFQNEDRAAEIADKMAAKYNDRFYIMKAIGYSEPRANVNRVKFSEKVIETSAEEKS